ncbi:hypothetical protein D3OALGB2SA_3116 [Olavius algarvensis associated proteobacterium Delta 3]|nr:hypothetical protein D3OALGB2SA_3116 [Olavius algarvensis associated proteobacterium Delta 3]
MKVICPSCNADYNIPETRIPASGAKATCKRCSGKIVIKPPVAASHADTTPTSKSKRATPTLPPVQTARFRVPPPPEGGISDASKFDHPCFAVFPKLETVPSANLDFDEILTVNKKGGYKSGKNKIKVNVITCVAPVLKDILENDEVVKKVARGVANYPLEVLLGNGALTLLYNRYAILCTDRRVIMINTTYRMKRPTHYLFQIPYADIKKVKRGFIFTNLTFLRKTGKKRIFNYVDRFSLKEVAEFVTTQIEEPKPAGKLKALFDDLCPSCFVPLEKGLQTCAHCQTGFKTPRTAFLKSLLLPGWGDLYLGHRLLGGLELLVSVGIWFVIISTLLSPSMETFIAAGILLIVFNVMDSLLTLHMAKKGYMAA